MFAIRVLVFYLLSLFCGVQVLAQPIPSPLRTSLGDATHIWLHSEAIANEPQGIHLSVEGRSISSEFSTSTRQCESLIRRLRSLTPTFTIRSLGHQLRIQLASLRSGRRVLYRSDSFLCSPFEYTGENTNDNRSESASLRSLVGPIVTIHTKTSEAAAGGPSYHLGKWQSLDLRTGNTIPVLDVVDEGSLVVALQHDPYILERFADLRDELNACTSLAQIRTLLESDTAQVDGIPRRVRGLESFAFADYNVRSQEVALRLAFHTYECGMCGNDVKTLGLWVKVRSSYHESFRAALKGYGHFASAPPIPL